MPKLFHLRCSPRSDSASSAAAEAFLARFRERRPNWDVDVMDLWRESLPEFKGEALSAKYARLEGRTFSDPERDAWAMIERMVLRLSLAERVLVSTPMWNFGVPYKLKHWIDLVSQPGLTFRFEPSRGYIPLLQNRPTLVIVASGSDFMTGMNRGRIDM
ncbi:MAG: NAD(P)H-dependent oxidoreductase, partial [Hyphomicrobiales bacterium]|nr:NAD(P)H-dependent oxidoreductase [Hyphomicrobiales bacterium]